MGRGGALPPAVWEVVQCSGLPGMARGATWPPSLKRTPGSAGRRHLPGIGRQVGAVLGLQPRAESCTSLSSQVTYACFLFCTGVPMTSEAVASCSGDAFWTPGPHLCLQPPLCHSPALSSFLPVGLLILPVGLVISTPGIVGTSPTMVCRVAGSRSRGVWLYSSESALWVLPSARPLSGSHAVYRLFCAGLRAPV